MHNIHTAICFTLRRFCEHIQYRVIVRGVLYTEAMISIGWSNLFTFTHILLCYICILNLLLFFLWLLARSLRSLHVYYTIFAIYINITLGIDHCLVCSIYTDVSGVGSSLVFRGWLPLYWEMSFFCLFWV